MDGSFIDKEPSIDNIVFKVHSYSKNKGKPYLFINCMVEFGCEFFLPHYLLQSIKQKHDDKYIVAFGWNGREFLYRGLVDEFWELTEEFMWLRETTRAFHNVSNNIKKVENTLKKSGLVIESHRLGNMVIESHCLECKKIFPDYLAKTICPRCYSSKISRSLFSDWKNTKKKYRSLNKPSCLHREWVDKNFPEKICAIFPRNRKTYGRNLPFEFYSDLVDRIHSIGYSPVWVGEKFGRMRCPTGAIDFLGMNESYDLEYTLALIEKCAFTFQCWTASTRLSQAMNVPFVLVEDPEQIYKGHEGRRLELFTQDYQKKKFVFCHYRKVLENMNGFLNLCVDSIISLLNRDSSDVIGFVGDENYVKDMQDKTRFVI